MPRGGVDGELAVAPEHVHPLFEGAVDGAEADDELVVLYDRGGFVEEEGEAAGLPDDDGLT